MELLRTIVDGQMGAEDKIERLKELGIREDRKIEEEVRNMGSFADAIERRALDKGFNRGLDQGYAKGIDQGIAQRHKPKAWTMKKSAPRDFSGF